MERGISISSSSNIQSMTTEASTSSGTIMASGVVPTGKKAHLRKSAGQVWSDETLDSWPENDYRIFCGDLGNEVTDEVLSNAFRKYSSFQKSKVIRDRKTGKSRGYGFVSFKDPQDMLSALNQMNKKYVGNRPIRVTRSKWKDREINSEKNKSIADLMKATKSDSKTLRKFKRTGKPVTGGKKVLKDAEVKPIKRGRGYYGPGGAARMAHYQYGGVGPRVGASEFSTRPTGGEGHLLANI